MDTLKISSENIMPRNITAPVCTALFLGLGAVSLHAQIVAVESTFNPGGTYYSLSSDRTYGWKFSVGDTPISVTHLGYFDTGLDGLTDAQQVGIWDSSGSLMTQATVPSGTEGTLVNAYRFTLAPPATLEANTTYYIGALSPTTSDLNIAFDTPQIYASEINYEMATYSAGGFTAPLTSFTAANDGIFGPNFQFTPVPEPHHYALFTGLGLAGFFFIRKKLRSDSSHPTVV